MLIAYLGNFGNKFSDTTEKHIVFSLEKLGHEVTQIDEKDFDVDEIVKTCRGKDLLLFHKGGQAFDVELPELIELLNKVTIPKVFWYFDKVFDGEREHWMHTVIPYIDHAFLTDGTWIRRQNYPNITYLNQGIGDEDTSLGEFKEEYACDIAFFGSVYGAQRESFVRGLQETYGDKFRIFSNVFGRDLYDACASVKIIVSPRTPQDDFYWSSRVYMTTGSGGFMLYPKLEGLKEEFKKDEEVAMYATGHQLKDKIDYYLENEEERKKIQIAGYKKTITDYTYSKRLETLIHTLVKNKIV
jgi:hypothetical protein|tara:strand:- start:14389 stop:15285 length:897 start_codon:yes stop_codon:yes gene_type:complete